jgi:hypothetical protein
VTFGGLFPLGGFGEAFLPHPDNMNVDVIQVAGTKVSMVRMHMFTMAFLIKPPPLRFIIRQKNLLLCTRSNTLCSADNPITA